MARENKGNSKVVNTKEAKKDVAYPQSKLTPLPIATLEDADQLRLFACPNCGGVHFRHAGYMEVQIPFQDPDNKDVKVATDSRSVKLCVACRHSYISHDSKTWDVTKFIDVEAWEKSEVVAHKATGPGGQC